MTVDKYPWLSSSSSYMDLLDSLHSITGVLAADRSVSSLGLLSSSIGSAARALTADPSITSMGLLAKSMHSATSGLAPDQTFNSPGLLGSSIGLAARAFTTEASIGLLAKSMHSATSGLATDQIFNSPGLLGSSISLAARAFTTESSIGLLAKSMHSAAGALTTDRIFDSTGLLGGSISAATPSIDYVRPWSMGELTPVAPPSRLSRWTIVVGKYQQRFTLRGIECADQFEGLVAALERDDVERVRHVAATLRAFWLELLNIFADVETIQLQFAIEPDEKAGGPVVSRKQRIAYLLSGGKSIAIHEGNRSQVDAAIDLWDELNKGDHTWRLSQMEERLESLVSAVLASADRMLNALISGKRPH
jgi:Predicted pPIWI-associating nuclease